MNIIYFTTHIEYEFCNRLFCALLPTYKIETAGLINHINKSKILQNNAKFKKIIIKYKINIFTHTCTAFTHQG